MAYVESDPNCQPAEAEFTMTSSHAGETIEEVIFFGLISTAFDSHDFDRFLVLSVGHRAGLRDEVEAAIRSVWGDA
jgi:hypothetical protein